MSAVGEAMRQLMALGVEGDALVEAVERLIDVVREQSDRDLHSIVSAAAAKADASLLQPSAGAERTRRWRERKTSPEASQTVTDRHETSPCDAPSLETKVSPEPPSKTQTLSQPTPPIVPRSLGQPDLRQAEDAIWADTPKLGRERSGRKELARALGAAVRRGHDPARVRLGVRAAYASESYSGEHAKGVHRLIETGRWESFLEPDPVKRIEAADWSPERWKIAVELFHERGLWKPELGPKPGEPGCRAPPEIGADILPFPTDQRAKA